MTVGMFLAALAFIVAALVQIQIDVSVTHIKTYNTVQLRHFYEAKLSLTHTHISVSLPENHATVPIKQTRPNEVHQHA